MQSLFIANENIPSVYIFNPSHISKVHYRQKSMFHIKERTTCVNTKYFKIKMKIEKLKYISYPGLTDHNQCIISLHIQQIYAHVEIKLEVQFIDENYP
jgi:hypothetical protein